MTDKTLDDLLERQGYNDPDCICHVMTLGHFGEPLHNPEVVWFPACPVHGKNVTGLEYERQRQVTGDGETG